MGGGSIETRFSPPSPPQSQSQEATMAEETVETCPSCKGARGFVVERLIGHSHFICETCNGMGMVPIDHRSAEENAEQVGEGNDGG